MSEYEPLDLSPYFNAGTSTLNVEDIQRGLHLRRGLPFQFSDDPQRYCIAPSTSSVRVEVDRLARHLVFAHRPLAASSEIVGLGATVAEYRFHLEGDRNISARVRHRFEITVVPTDWGLLPFL